MCDGCNFDKYLKAADLMMSDTDYDFALETVEGIHDTIEKNQHVTLGQIRALDNIYNSVKDREDDR